MHSPLDIWSFRSQPGYLVVATAQRTGTLAPSSGARRMFCLRLGARTIALDVGRLVIGRGAEAQIRLASRHVSRQHAILTVTPDRVLIEDRSSRNGVFVNGTPLDASVCLEIGDVIQVGDKQLVLETQKRVSGPMASVGRLLHLDAPFTDEKLEIAGPVTLERLQYVADRVIFPGNGEQAEGALKSPLMRVLSHPAPAALDADLCRFAARTAIRLAVLTENGAWLDYVFRLYFMRPELLPLSLVHALFAATAKARTQDRTAVRRYIDLLRREETRFGDDVSIVLHRLERFERL